MYYNLEETAEKLGKHPITVYNYLNHGFNAPNGAVVKLEGRKIGKNWRVSDEDIEKFIKDINDNQ